MSRQAFDEGPARWTVVVRDLELDCSIGMRAHERHRPQRVRFRVELGMAAAGMPGGVGDVFNYETVVEGVTRICSAGHVDLVETLGEQVAALCLADPRIDWARVAVEKPDAFPGSTVAGVVVERHRNSPLPAPAGGAMTRTEQGLDEATIAARLAAELPHWSADGAWIRRVYRTAGWKGTLMVVNAVGHLAEAAWHHPDIKASWDKVEVRLQTHTAGRVTEKDLELARMIEQVVQWQPGRAGGALEGTPATDPRYAYVLYD